MLGSMILAWMGCAQPPPAAEGPTYWRDAKPILDAHCVSCHQEGELAPFSLATYEEAAAWAAPIRVAVEQGTMPPWPPGEGCNEYEGNRALPEDQKAALLQWTEQTLEGSPSDEGEPIVLDPGPPFEPQLELALPEPYTPPPQSDDYRCQLIDWPLDHEAYVVGLQVAPDQRSMVHHTIVFAASAESAQRFRDMDAAEPGPGYTCFGGPNGGSVEEPSLEDLSLEELIAELQSRGGGQRWIGAWVPGSRTSSFPPGTGLLMEPGDVLIVQMHYNTSSDEPQSDQSVVQIAYADQVERPAMILPFTDLGWVSGSELLGGPMLLPAGQSPIYHETVSAGDGVMPQAARTVLGLAEDSPLVIHGVAHHMHQLGVSGHQEVRHASGARSCLVDIPRWDFSWQGSYGLSTPVQLLPEDELMMSCTWDNSAGTQDVTWGEGTSDEMCLSTLYLTGP
jgi:hypothetical protein